MNSYGMHKTLFDPVERTKEIPEDLFRKYIDIFETTSNVLKIPTTPGLPTKIKDAFFGSHSDVDKAALKKIWNILYERISTNEAFAQFVLDFHGAESDFFFPWLISVATSPSEALELGYNAGRNLEGEWVENIPVDDPISVFVTGMPTVAYNRLRQLKVADLVTSERDLQDDCKSPVHIKAGLKSKILDLGAGRMAWARHHGFTFSPDTQVIMAIDADKNIRPDKLFCRPLDEMGIVYEQGNFLPKLKDSAYMNATLVILQGVASYFSVEIFREMIVKPIYHLLVEDGRFFFDLQVEHLSYVWGTKLFGWPEMMMPKNVSEAICIVENMLKDLKNEGIHFRASYEPDSYNREPLSVMVTLTKV